MELRQLRYFLRTAESLSFSKAAQRLCISQSTLSQQIRQLEQELDVQLFVRDSHSVRLTDAGQLLCHTAERTLRAAEECRHQMEDMRTELCGTVRVGVTESCAAILQQPLRDFIRLYPRVNVFVHYTGTHSMQEMLYRRQLDFAMAFAPHVPDPELDAEILFSDKLCAIMSVSHALSRSRSLMFSELPHSSLALPSPDMYARSVIDACMREAGVSIAPRMEVNDAAYLLDLVAHSGLVTLQAGATVVGRPELKAVPIADCPNELRGCVFTPRDAYVRRASSVLISMIRQESHLRRLLTT